MKKKRKKETKNSDVSSKKGSTVPPEPRRDLFAGTPVRLGILGVLLLLVLLTRFYSLQSQGFHHDEAIHCLHSWKIAHQGAQTYRYDPVYHGPFLYHWGGLFDFFSQDESLGKQTEADRFYHHLLPDRDWVGRLPFAVMGVFLVVIFFPLGKPLGWGTAFLITGLLILSPVVDYFSRFARNDVYQTAWLAGSIVCGVLYFQSRKVRYLTLVALFMALSYCTKENSYMNNFVLCSFVIFWGLAELLQSPRRTLERITLNYAPLVRWLVLFGSFSLFVFLFVAIDSRVSPETGLWRGMENILSHSTALTEKIDASDLKRETGYFTAVGREGVRHVYYRFAFGSTAFLLFAFEVLALLVRRRKRPDQPWVQDLLRLVLSLLFLSALVWSVLSLSTWVQSTDGKDFLKDLFTRQAIQLIGFGVLASLFLIPNRHEKRKLRSQETFDWWNLGVQLTLAETLYLFLFTSMGTHIKRGASAGLYDYISYWFKHQTGDFRIWGAWWYYLPRLFLYELFPIGVVCLVGTLLILGLARKVVIRKRKTRAGGASSLPEQFPVEERSQVSIYWKKIPGPLLAFAIYQLVFMLAIYAILNEKVPWLLTYQSFALNFLAAILLAHYLQTHPNTPGPVTGFVWDLFSPKGRLPMWRTASRLLVCGGLIFLILFAVGQHLTAVFVRPDYPTELLLYTGTTHRFAKHIEKIRKLRARARTAGKKLKIAVDGKSQWPCAWYFRNDSVRWKTVDLTRDIQILDDTKVNRQRMQFGGDKVWEVNPCDLRGWWIWHGTPKALPGELKFWPNVKAFLTNARNDKRHYFPKDQPPDKDYVLGFRDQVLRYVFQRKIWYPTGGEKILVCYKTDEEVPIDEREGHLDGTFKKETHLFALRSWGASSQPPISLAQPRGLAVTPGGALVVADSKNGRVLVLNDRGEVTRTIGAGILNPDVTGPCGVACDSEGNFYVADTWNHSIRKFTSEGDLLATFKSENHGRVRTALFGPRGIAVSTTGRVYVTDTGNHCVRVFDSHLKYLETWGGAGNQVGQFKEPVGIAVNEEQEVFVADTGNGRIQEFSENGEFLNQYKTLVPADTEVSGVEPNLTFLPDKRLVLSQSNHGTIWVIDLEKKRVKRYVVTRPKLRSPLGLAVSPRGTLWVSGRDTDVICEVKIP